MNTSHSSSRHLGLRIYSMASDGEPALDIPPAAPDHGSVERHNVYYLETIVFRVRNFLLARIRDKKSIIDSSCRSRIPCFAFLAVNSNWSLKCLLLCFPCQQGTIALRAKTTIPLSCCRALKARISKACWN